MKEMKCKDDKIVWAEARLEVTSFACAGYEYSQLAFLYFVFIELLSVEIVLVDCG